MDMKELQEIVSRAFSGSVSSDDPITKAIAVVVIIVIFVWAGTSSHTRVKKQREHAKRGYYDFRRK
ncbi:MAG: hypothetical protein AB202_01075 [Parcubacteria bacterium C7867-007]|nr:MAG: hypothetical protein AB202_01075 [Parcubacteria bacterium C7867-007]